MAAKMVAVGAIIFLLFGILGTLESEVLASNASISSVPSVQNIAPGGTFDVSIRVNSDAQVRGAQFVVSWDASKAQCTSVTRGTFFSAFANANAGDVYYTPGAPQIDNTGGKFPKNVAAVGSTIITQSLNGATGPGNTFLGPTGQGDLYIMHMTAGAVASGTVTFTLSSTKLVDNTDNSGTIPSTTTNGQVTISANAANLAAVTTVAATNITASGATLNGNLATIGSETSLQVSFEYGTSVSYGSTTTPQTLTAAGAFNTTITGLTANVVYHFRAKAAGAATVYGDDMSFTAQAASGGGSALTVASMSASSITASEGTLNGNLTSLGGAASASVNFDYGTSTSYGTSTTVQTASATGSYSAAINSLSPNTVYHFRAKAAGSSTVYGNDTSFTTLPSAASPTTDTPAPITTLVVPASSTPASSAGSGQGAAAPAAPSANSAVPTKTASTPVLAQSVSAPRAFSVPSVTRAASTANNLYSTPLDLSDYMDTSGTIQKNYQQNNIRYSGNNQIVTLNIKPGIRMVASDGSPVQSITVQPGLNVPTVPADKNLVSAVDFGPSGARFSSPVTVVFGYDATQIPQNGSADSLSLVYFDEMAHKWTDADYSVDTLNHQITANLSHFSLYAVMASGGGAFMGMGWNWAGTIIVVELMAGACVIYYFLRRRRPLVPAAMAAFAVQPAPPAAAPVAVLADTQKTVTLNQSFVSTTKDQASIAWDDILQGNVKKGEPFKTQLEITGGKIVIPRDGKSADIELINSPDSKILLSMQYDPELYPRGLAKIMILGQDPVYEKSKEVGK